MQSRPAPSLFRNWKSNSYAESTPQRSQQRRLQQPVNPQGHARTYKPFGRWSLLAWPVRRKQLREGGAHSCDQWVDGRCIRIRELHEHREYGDASERASSCAAT